MNVDTYWDGFYESPLSEEIRIPSQFAAFSASFFSKKDLLIDFGCGSCRDTSFFHWLGYETHGLDASKAAINSAKKSYPYLNLSVADVDGLNQFIEKYYNEKGKKCNVYTRFVLHALNELESDEFMDLLARQAGKISCVSFEYRTTLDQKSPKLYSNHSRRFIDHLGFVSALNNCGFSVVYQIEGKGMAISGSEDATVGRVFARQGDAKQ